MLTKPGDVEDDARASQQVACIACRRVSQTFSPQVECIHEGEAGSSSFFFFFNLQQAGLRLSGHRHVRWMVCSHRSLFPGWDIEKNGAVCYRNAVYFWCWFFFFFTWTVAYSNNMVSLFFPHDQSREHSVSSVIWQLCSQKRFHIHRFIGDMILKWISKMIWCLCCVFH